MALLLESESGVVKNIEDWCFLQLPISKEMNSFDDELGH